MPSAADERRGPDRNLSPVDSRHADHLSGIFAIKIWVLADLELFHLHAVAGVGGELILAVSARDNQSNPFGGHRCR